MSSTQNIKHVSTKNPEEINDEFEKIIGNLPSEIQKQKVFLYIYELRKRLCLIPDDEQNDPANNSKSNVVSPYDFNKLLEKFEKSSDILNLLRNESKELVSSKKNRIITKKIADLQRIFIKDITSNPVSQTESVNVLQRIKEIEQKLHNND